MNRRELLQQMVVAGALIAPPATLTAHAASDRIGNLLPLRPLGKTGEQVTCLGLGGYHVGWPKSEKQVQAVIEKAIEVGIRFFDTAESYGKGRSEERYGKYLIPKYRDDIFLMTKSTGRDAATVREHLNGSLKRLNTDVIDLFQIHSLSNEEDVDMRLQQGVLDEILKAKEAGKIRYIGFTGHASPYAHVRMTETRAVLDHCSTCQFPINPVDAASKHSFIGHTIPAMQKNNIGILAMKSLADGRFFAKKQMEEKTIWTSDNPVVPNVLSIEECIHFTLSLPVATLITGAEIPEYVVEKADMVRRFSSQPESYRQGLADKVADFAEAGEVEYYKNKELRMKN